MNSYIGKLEFRCDCKIVLIALMGAFGKYFRTGHMHKWIWFSLLSPLHEDEATRLEIRQSTIYYAGLLRQQDKRIVDQESDVPSIIFFYTFYRFRALKTLYSYFCNFIKEIRNSIQRIFSKNFARNHKKKQYLEHQRLGRQFVCPIVQATQLNIF